MWISKEMVIRSERQQMVTRNSSEKLASYSESERERKRNISDGVVQCQGYQNVESHCITKYVLSCLHGLSTGDITIQQYCNEV
jgi:hypothetical protein